MRILILGINRFIGNALATRILTDTDWEVYGMDIRDDKLDECQGRERFHFVEGDICINKEWIEYHVKKCDVVLPLVAIATPATYVREPLRVFELDFEANLHVVRLCVTYGKRLVFPSTRRCTECRRTRSLTRTRAGPCWALSESNGGYTAPPSNSSTVLYGHTVLKRA